MVFQIRNIIVFKKVPLSTITMHCITWPLSLLLTFLPYTTENSLGTDDAQEGTNVCSYTGAQVDKLIWIAITFFGFLTLCFIIMVAMMVSVIIHFNANGPTITKRDRDIFHATRLYPTTILIVWLPALVVFVVVIFAEKSSKSVTAQAFVCITNVLYTQYGMACALIYFANSPQIRMKWNRLLFGTTFMDESNNGGEEFPHDTTISEVVAGAGPRSAIGSEHFGVSPHSIASSSRPNSNWATRVTDMSEWDRHLSVHWRGTGMGTGGGAEAAWGSDKDRNTTVESFGMAPVATTPGGDVSSPIQHEQWGPGAHHVGDRGRQASGEIVLSDLHPRTESNFDEASPHASALARALSESL